MYSKSQLLRILKSPIYPEEVLKQERLWKEIITNQKNKIDQTFWMDIFEECKDTPKNIENYSEFFKNEVVLSGLRLYQVGFYMIMLDCEVFKNLIEYSLKKYPMWFYSRSDPTIKDYDGNTILQCMSVGMLYRPMDKLLNSLYEKIKKKGSTYWCNHCPKLGDAVTRNLKYCDGCSNKGYFTYYCNVECQNKDWINHKTRCGKENSIMNKNQCHFCKNTEMEFHGVVVIPLRNCDRCEENGRTTLYCGKVCQKLDWKVHKNLCINDQHN